MENLLLDTIREVSGLSDGKSRQLKDTCIWMFLHCGHSSGTNLTLQDGETSDQYSVSWIDDVDTEAIRRSYNIDDAKEFGAEALALLIAIRRTEYTAVERSTTTTGIDYWLGFQDTDPNQPFHRAGRLEMTGMIESPSNTIPQRLKVKNRQTRQSDGSTFPVYVIVVEFSRPHAVMMVRHANS